MNRRPPCPWHWSPKQRLDHYTRIDSTGCHIFTGTIGNHGYGRLRVQNIEHTTHRLAWELANGPIPAGMHILHSCDNRACVNPAHLRLGTNNDNVRDMMDKRRWGPPRGNPKGEAHAKAKLTEAQARSIFLSEGTQTEIAARFGVRQTTVSMIKNKQTWSHIHDPPFRA